MTVACKWQALKADVVFLEHHLCSKGGTGASLAPTAVADRDAFRFTEACKPNRAAYTLT